MKDLLPYAVLAALAYGVYWLWKRGGFAVATPAMLPEIPPGPGQPLTPYELCVRSGQSPDLCRFADAAFVSAVHAATDSLLGGNNPLADKFNATLNRATGAPAGTRYKVDCAHIGPVKLWGSGC